MRESLRGRILLVTKNDAPRGREELDEAGFDVVRASAGAQPLEALADGGFDLVITDLAPSEMSGLALAGRIRERGLALPVIILSNKKSAALSARATQKGALLCQPSLLLETVRRTARTRAPVATRAAAPLPFRNRRGEQITVGSFTATAAKNEFGRVLDAALEHGAVAITRHDSAKAVLLAVDEYNALVGQQTSELDMLTDEFDALLSRMQTAGAKKSVRAAFEASPVELGRVAAAAARKRG